MEVRKLFQVRGARLTTQHDIVGEFWEAWENYRAVGGSRPSFRQWIEQLQADGGERSRINNLLDVELSGGRALGEQPQGDDYDELPPDVRSMIRALLDGSERLPDKIGRYRIERQLGFGGFGSVLLGHDDDLQRQVAIKVPCAQLVREREDAELYLDEARTVANLDHPNIVPVHDVGSTDEFPCYIVSKYVSGTDLRHWSNNARPPFAEIANTIAAVAEALHYAHKHGVVHRDIKPGNILIDEEGRRTLSILVWR